ncbi:hypothetical protein M0R45_025752 [Rubus argutus]|uniref:Uncharacterized protein n=1 Tax=Rubus argutus TaxID=59490 RepID=A0AAW1WVJ0_RUBAR
MNSWSNGQGAGEAQQIEAAGQAFQRPQATFLRPRSCLSKKKRKRQSNIVDNLSIEPLKASFILIYHYQKQIEEETHIVAEKAPVEKQPKVGKKLPKESGAAARDKKNKTKKSLEEKI